MGSGISRVRTRTGSEIVEARSGLLPDACWRPATGSDPTELVCSVRQELAEMIPLLREKFNFDRRYFGYHLPGDKDRAYIYLQKKKLVIDLCASTDLASHLRRLGFDVRPKSNFEAKIGWLTGWRVPYSTANVREVVTWICKAFPVH